MYTWPRKLAPQVRFPRNWLSRFKKSGYSRNLNAVPHYSAKTTEHFSLELRSAEEMVPAHSVLVVCHSVFTSLFLVPMMPFANHDLWSPIKKFFKKVKWNEKWGPFLFPEFLWEIFKHFSEQFELEPHSDKEIAIDSVCCLVFTTVTSNAVFFLFFLILMMPIFHFSSRFLSKNSHPSAASSSSSLWDYTLLQPVPPALCFCHFRATSESCFDSKKQLLSLWVFLCGDCSALVEVGLLFLITSSPARRRCDSSRGTMVYVWVSRWVWVTVKWMSVHRGKKKRDKGGKNESPKRATVYEQCIVICSGFAVELCAFRGKRKNIPD